jgi:hypothetical protein
MRISIISMTALLITCSAAFAETPAQQVQQYNGDIHQLNTDIRNNRNDLSTDKKVETDQRADLARDRADAAADRQRAEADLAKGNSKGASYWNSQLQKEHQKGSAEYKNLVHTKADVHADASRLNKDLKVRHNDIGKRNRAAGRS